MNIILRKKASLHANENEEHILVDRGEGKARYVVARATPHTLSNGEWFWGHYFETYGEALEFYDQRPPITTPVPPPADALSECEHGYSHGCKACNPDS